AIVQPAQGDGNARDDDPESVSVPVSDFVTLRRTDEQQHKYFLGADARGVPFGPVRAGAQLTPTREHVARDLGPLSAIRAPDFSAMQSFIPGGLGAAWGASVMPWCDEELRGWPIARADLQPHY